jgi:hypothetical protein
MPFARARVGRSGLDWGVKEMDRCTKTMQYQMWTSAYGTTVPDLYSPELPCPDLVHPVPFRDWTYTAPVLYSPAACVRTRGVERARAPAHPAPLEEYPRAREAKCQMV